MLTDATGAERKGIAVFGELIHICPNGFMCGSSTPSLIGELEKAGSAAARFYETILALLLAGF